MNYDFPKKLQSLREKKNWTKTDVKKRLGIKTLSTYANWEYGLREPDFDTLIKIAELYDVSIDYLLRRTDEPSVNEINYGEDIDDPELKRWLLELPKSSEEELKNLRKLWEVIQNNKNK